MDAVYSQVRIARPTNQLDVVIRFYCNGLGLPVIGSFSDHDGYSGVMLGMPDASYHLEFTQHITASICQAPSKDNLIVFYYDGKEERDIVAKRLFEMGYAEVEPENPYWRTDGITIEDPDGWRVVLMQIPDFATKK
ncbi:MAG TPA: VOC family protein [Candidatus Kapabacteria bacterium]|nr:VOC family protein [Candidatus Kapabacteria bacterium]